MELKVSFLAVGNSISALTLDLPPEPSSFPPPHLPDLHTHSGGKLLYFSPLLLGTSEEEIRFTIAHEIAHAVLGDLEDVAQNAQDTAKRQEQETDELAQCWGFKRPSTVPAA